MAKFEVCITESIDFVYEVEADDADEAAVIAMELDSDQAVRQNFRERIHDWTSETA